MGEVREKEKGREVLKAVRREGIGLKTEKKRLRKEGRKMWEQRGGSYRGGEE